MTKDDKNLLVQKIRSNYIEKDITELDELKRLDANVKRPANIFAYVFGSISAVIMGSGMSLVMTDIGDTVGVGNSMLFGIIIGVLGLALASINYPIFKRILEGRRKKYSKEILKLSDEIMSKSENV